MSVQSITRRVRGKDNDRDIRYPVVSAGRKFTVLIHSTDPTFDEVAYQAILETKLNNSLAEAEVDNWIDNDDPVVTPLDAVIPRYLSQWRAYFKGIENNGPESVRAAALMKSAVDDNQFSIPQMNNAWKMNNPQRNGFLDRLELKRVKHENVKNEVSE